MPAVPIIFFKPPTALIGDGDTIRAAGRLPAGGVRGGDRRGHRDADPARATRPRRSARSAGTPVSTTSPAATSRRGRSVGPGQGVRHVLPGRAPGGRRGWTGATSRSSAGSMARSGSAPGPPTCTSPIPGPGVVPQRRHDPGAGRPHRHRNAGRNRAAAGRRRGGSRDPRRRRALQPGAGPTHR